MIRCTIDPHEILGSLTDLEQRQLPFAIAQSLTRVATTARAKVQQAMPQVFDRPTPATVKGVMYRPANKTRLDEGSTVYIQDEGNGKSLSPAKWLNTEVQGGKRRDKRLEVALKAKGVMPKDAQTAVSRFAPLDAFGNLKGSFVVQLMSILNLLAETGYAANQTAKSKARNAKRTKKAPDYFIGRPEGSRGRTGIWERIDSAFGSAIRPILYFIKPPTYRTRLPFFGMVDGVFQQMAPEDLRTSLNDAVKTALHK
jgi:hypothetical protein